MSTFSIEFQPPLPQTKTKTDELALARFDFGDLDLGLILARHTQEYDLVYWIGSEIYGYYPGSIVTVLGDVREEWRLARSRTSHDMTISGYPVLRVEFEGDKASFLDLVELSKHGTRKLIAEPVDATIVEEAFRSAFEQVLGVAKEFE